VFDDRKQVEDRLDCVLKQRIRPAVARAQLVDLLERPLDQEITPEPDGPVRLRLRPFQVITVRLTPGS
jgi:hypothetical protein